MHSADVDSDGYDEVILGSCVINENGRGLWSTGLSHPDHCYVGDIDPGHPGLEIYYGIEAVVQPIPKYDNGICLVDAATGNVLWGIEENAYHIHQQGLVSDIDPSNPGMECYSGEDDYPKRWLHSANGTLIANEDTFDMGLRPKAVYWDADLQRELLHEGRIFDYETNYTHFYNVQGYQVAWADILGDWREEIIVSIEGELRIYTTTLPAQDRRICLMQDPIYRTDVAHLSMGYAQVPTTSYCLDNTSTSISNYPESGNTFLPFVLSCIVITVIIESTLSLVIITYWRLKRNQKIKDTTNSTN
jgi:rhamnogalacturonan endolyase